MELALSQQDKGNGLVDMHTGIQYLRGIFRSSSFARHAYLICRYEYETWCFSMHVYIYIYTRMFTDSIVKEEEKERGEKKKIDPPTERTREQRCERTLNDIDAKLSQWKVDRCLRHSSPDMESPKIPRTLLFPAQRIGSVRKPVRIRVKYAKTKSS